MAQSIVGHVWRAFRAAIGKVLRAGGVGFVSGAALVEGLAAFFNKTAGTGDFTPGFLPQLHIATPTTFTHIMAGVVGVLLAYLAAFTVAVTQTLRGVIYAAEHVDDVAGAVADKGLDLVDAAVDAVDGPDRHGFRGKRGPVPVKSAGG